MAGPTAETPPAFIAMCHFQFLSVEDFLAAFQPHAEVLQGDMPNYTDITRSKLPIMNFKELVRIYGQDCESIIETIDSPKMFSFVQINKAVLFVLATWSARSIQAFQALTTALKARDRNIQILVVNIDDLKESVP